MNGSIPSTLSVAVDKAICSDRTFGWTAISESAIAGVTVKAIGSSSTLINAAGAELSFPVCTEILCSKIAVDAEEDDESIGGENWASLSFELVASILDSTPLLEPSRQILTRLSL